MPQSVALSLPHPRALLWLTRLATGLRTGTRLREDPVAFAGWYAMAGELVDWPEAVERIRTEERARSLGLEQMVSLLRQVNYSLSGRLSATQARSVLEGYAVHAWVQREPRAFIQCVERAQAQLVRVVTGLESCEDVTLGGAFAQRVRELARVLALDALEEELLAFGFLSAAADDLSGVLEQLACDRWAAETLWPTLFDTTPEMLARALRPRSALRLSGLLQATSKRVQIASVSPFWLELVARADSLFDAVLEPWGERPGAGAPARLDEADLEQARRLLAAQTEPGVNLMLYASASLDKRALVQTLAQGASRSVWRVREFPEASRQDNASLIFVAFCLLAAKDEPSVLVIERPTEVLTQAPSALLRALFGVELSEERIEPFDEHLLTRNAVPGLWLLEDPASLSQQTVARFIFHAPLKRATREELAARYRERLAALKLTRDAHTELEKLEGVSDAQLDAAARAARLIGARTRRERDAALVNAVRRSQRALSRSLAAREQQSVTQYPLKYLNTAGRFGPEQILRCFERTPRGTVVLYGPPGTGKTQFVEYLAQKLGRPLIARRASELLAKYVGESEKNIAAAFAEAQAEDAILFLDEGDSFLRERARAQQHWEVTQVNELLQHMERFEGIFVVATNLFQGLDVAALRRFTFKVEFRSLDIEQRWEMFVNEAGLRGKLGAYSRATREGWESRLAFMRELTAGDFATVKRQCLLLGETLTPEQWLEQLELECSVKPASTGSGSN